MMKRKMAWVLILMCAVLFSGCLGRKAAPEKEAPEKTTGGGKVGGAFQMRLNAEPPTLDPAMVTDTISSQVVENLFDGLVQYDQNLSVRGAIARDWSVSEDGLVWTFHLNHGVKFHNGREVTADDVLYSFTRILDPATHSPRGWMFAEVKGAEDFQTQKAPTVAGFRVVDPYTFEVTLARPFTPFLSVLAMPNAAIVPKEELTKYGRDFTYHPTGTGAFKFAEWIHGDHLTLAANTDYFEGRPYLDKIVYQIIADDSTAFNEYEQDNLYLLTTIPAGQIDRVVKGEEFHDELVKTPRLGLYYLGFNTTKPPLDNKKVRQAIAQAINKRAIADVLRHGTVVAATYGILPPGVPGFSQTITSLPYDVAKAINTLTLGGYPTGVPAELELAFNSGSENQLIAQAIMADLKEIGIKVRLVGVGWGAFIAKVDSGGTEIFRNGWIADYPDPDNFLYVLLNSANAGPGGNGSFYHNSEVDRLTLQGRTMKAGEERFKVYRQVEKIVADDVPIVPIYYYTNLLLRKPYIQGLNVTALGIMPLKTVWLSEK